MKFKKLSYYLYHVQITIKCDHAPLHKFPTAHTLISKANNWESEIASMNHVTFELIKSTDNILADSISCIRSIHLYDPLALAGEAKTLDLIFVKN